MQKGVCVREHKKTGFLPKLKLTAAVFLSLLLVLSTACGRVDRSDINDNASPSPSALPQSTPSASPGPSLSPTPLSTPSPSPSLVPGNNEKTSDNEKNIQPNIITDEKIKSAIENLPEGLSNELMGWWFTRNSEHLPTVHPSEMRDIVDRYNGIYLGDTSRKVIYLTFDEGYENGYTPQILDTLKKMDVRATFFITGGYLRYSSDLVGRMIKEGHVVGNHTDNHPHMTECSNEEIVREIVQLHKDVEEKFGYNMTLMRPPYGEFSERVLVIASNLGYRNVFWSYAYTDWDVNDQKGADYAYQQVMNNYHNGQVLLLHAVSKDNAEALERIITDLKKLGYAFETPDQIEIK